MNPAQSRRTFLKTLGLAGIAFTIVPRHVLGRGFIAPSDRIALGFIGLGKQGQGLSSRFVERAGAQVVAGCDVWTTKQKAFNQHVVTAYAAQPHGAGIKSIDLYDDYRQLLDRKDIDAVVIATPDHWHAMQAVAAMKAGKDVFCEKPMTLTIQGGIDMVKTAKTTGRIVQVGSMQRSWKSFKKACELVRNGYIG